jgi:hypothetical protein
VTRARFLPGALLASVLIGPLVGAVGLVASALTDRDTALTTFYASPLVLLFAMPVGFAVSIVPNLIGTAVLAWAGRENEGVRLPALWALVGAAAGWGLGLGLARGSSTNTGPAMLAAIGVASALLCRWRTRWN